MSAAVVTGASGAIGRAIAQRLVQAGRPVVLVDRDESVAHVREELCGGGTAAEACLIDIADPGAPHAVREAADRLGGAAVLVNNAGITRDGRVNDLSTEDFRLVIRINLVAALRLAKELAPSLDEGGAIVNVASRAALGNFGQANYVAAKSALIGATRALALEHAPRIRVNVVAPGLVDTPMTQAMPAPVLEKLVSRVPAGRAAEPDEIAGVVGFLCSDDASYVTGQVLLACGGRSIVG